MAKLLEICFLRFMRFAKISNQLNEEEEFSFTPGTYEVHVLGHGGALPMKVSFTEKKIESIDIDSAGETEGLADVVFVRIPDKIIEGQTLNVDALSRALKQEFAAYQEQFGSNKAYLFDSPLLHRMQTYFGGKRSDLQGNGIYGQYDLVKILTDSALE